MKKILILISMLVICSTIGMCLSSCHKTSSRTIFQIASNGSISELNEALKSKADVNAVGENGMTPLMFATQRGSNPEIITALIQAGAKVDDRDNIGNTPFMYALSQKYFRYESSEIDNYLKVISILLKAGANINDKNNNGMTPLMLTARWNGNSDIIQSLIDKDAKLNERDNNGMTSLMYAVRDNDIPNVVIKLISAGADCKAKDNKDKTALDYIKENDLKDSEAYRLLKKKLAE